MKVSSKGLSLVKKWEGFYSKAYIDPVGVVTIGYGTTKWVDGSKVKMGQTITAQQALDLLERQVNEHASTIPQYVKRTLSQSQFDALASFQYNLGKHILAKNPTLVNALNRGDWVTATQQMLLYNKGRVGGVLQVLRGLDNRRREEVQLFMAKDVTPTKPTPVDEELIVATKFVKDMKISDGLNADQPLTRGQMFKMLYRMKDLIGK
ncbi:lysozyme [Lysinibacillus fusiformis]|uniref:lysozyme n=1 Tax=Lysinibacillus fusiformis TaxID=28031 RepID=UPI003CFF7CD3